MSAVDNEKKPVVKRVWSIDDELLLLQGFIDYELKKGCYPLSDMDGFYKFTVSILPGDVSKSQLYEKIRRLKRKFQANPEKVFVFSKPHERKLFELSSKIWGFGENVRVSKVKAKTEMREKDFETLYPYWNAGLISEVSSALKLPDGVVELVKENFSFIGEDKAKEMNEKWKSIFANETMLIKRRTALLREIGI